MKIAKTVKILQNHLNLEREAGNRIGFVPTMGALHEGHMSLVRESRRTCDVTVVSIFVNPAQFNEKKDFDNYPITIDEDLKQLEEAGVDYVFIPAPEEVYPEGLEIPPTELTELKDHLEGEMRPGHFEGVAKVIYRFFDTIGPDKAFFGQKDFQQTVVVKKVAQQLGNKTEIVVCPIERENNGLAMSSRNVRLSDDDRQKAGFLYRALVKLKEDCVYKPLTEALTHTRKFLESKPDVEIEYLEAVDGNTMEIVNDLSNDFVVCVTVVRFGGIRMLDNIILKDK